jgi:hypothetical protein
MSDSNELNLRAISLQPGNVTLDEVRKQMRQMSTNHNVVHNNNNNNNNNHKRCTTSPTRLNHNNNNMTQQDNNNCTTTDSILFSLDEEQQQQHTVDANEVCATKGDNETKTVCDNDEKVGCCCCAFISLFCCCRIAAQRCQQRVKLWVFCRRHGWNMKQLMRVY